MLQTSFEVIMILILKKKIFNFDLIIFSTLKKACLAIIQYKFVKQCCSVQATAVQFIIKYNNTRI